VNYRIRTIGDLLQVPIDRLETCLAELRLALELHHFAFGEDAHPNTLDVIEWTDDGAKHVTVTDSAGADVLSLRVTTEGA